MIEQFSLETDKKLGTPHNQKQNLDDQLDKIDPNDELAIGSESKTQTAERSEKEQLLEEFLAKAEELRQKAKQEYENFMSERIANYKKLVIDIQQFEEKIEEGDLDTMLRLNSHDFSIASFPNLKMRANNVGPFDGSGRSEMEDIKFKTFSKYEKDFDTLKGDAKKKGIELPTKKPMFKDGQGDPFFRLFDINKQDGHFLDTLKQRGEEMQRKIKEKVNEFMDSKIKELDKLERDYKAMPEYLELNNLNDQLELLKNKKTGILFSENKKNEQLNELKGKIDKTDGVIRKFKGDRRDEIGVALSDFKNKFRFDGNLFDEKKYHSIFIKLNSL